MTFILIITVGLLTVAMLGAIAAGVFAIYTKD
ncbi:hypothetical protein HRbin23_00129 [bacterium HR23]|nr:hypothetical protein HRbin23_00129 [bacterium HR23]